MQRPLTTKLPERSRSPWPFEYGVGFPRQKGFIHLAASFSENAIRWDLAASGELNAVIQHDFMNANGEWLPISKGGDLGLRKDGEPIHCTLGTESPV